MRGKLGGGCDTFRGSNVAVDGGSTTLNRTKSATWASALAGGVTFGVLTWLFSDMGMGYAVLTGAVFTTVWLALGYLRTRRRAGG